MATNRSWVGHPFRLFRIGIRGFIKLGYALRQTNLTVTHVRHYFGSKVSIWTDAARFWRAQNVASVPGSWVETPLASPLALTNGVRYRVGVYLREYKLLLGVGPGGSFPERNH